MIKDYDKAIFIQIAELLCDRLLSGYYNIYEQAPSIRALASELQVNPNTVIRTYEKLKKDDIIYIKRGIGYFFKEDSVNTILNIKRDYFKEKTLPSFFKEMELLGITIEDIIKIYNTTI